MSEKIFALLLRLYPARFRARYGEESLQLLRDRLRDEAGLLARLRLAFDLFTDTAFALLRAHRMAQPAMQLATTRAPLAGLPSFGILDRPPLRRSAVIVAAALSLSGTAAFFLLLNYAGVRPGSRLATLEAHPTPAQRRTAVLRNPAHSSARHRARSYQERRRRTQHSHR